MANADFGDVPIREITAPRILACLRPVEAKGNFETAKRLRSTIGQVFRYAIATARADTDPTYALRGALITPKVSLSRYDTETRAADPEVFIKRWQQRQRNQSE